MSELLRIYSITDQDLHTLAGEIRARRARERWTQSVLARKAAVGRATITKLEAAKHRPRRVTLEAIARALGTTAEELLGEE